MKRRHNRTGELNGRSCVKVGLIGAGNVGSACLLSLVGRGVAREIVVIDSRRERALGVVTDLQYGAPLACPVTLKAGDYDDLAGAAVVVVTAGINEKAGGATDRSDPAGRLKLLDRNAEIYRDIIPKIVRSAAEAVILVVTDPPDALADIARKLAGHGKVLSSGTFLDTLRFRFHLASKLNVHPMCVDAQVLGEHGTSQVFIWSSARIAGTPIEAAFARSGEDLTFVKQQVERDVRFANIAIIEGSGASQLGIGMVAARIVHAVIEDENAALPIGSYHDRYEVTLSLPVIVGHGGVSQVLEPAMSSEERAALDQSAETLRAAL